jgi:hypothetical protein
MTLVLKEFLWIIVGIVTCWNIYLEFASYNYKVEGSCNVVMLITHGLKAKNYIRKSYK